MRGAESGGIGARDALWPAEVVRVASWRMLAPLAPLEVTSPRIVYAGLPATGIS